MAQATLGDDPPHASAVWTLGYEGRDLDAFLDALREAGIRLVADVRENPWSRKPGFSKKELSGALAEAGIAYEHMGDLGCPSELRHEAEHASQEFEVGYRRHLEEHGDAVQALVLAAGQRRTAVMCMERRVEECHRRVLAEALREAGFQVRHL